jgi:hypothetical protein
VPIFSQIEVNKYQKYANFGVKTEVVDSDPWGGGYPKKAKGADIFDRVGNRVADWAEAPHQNAVKKVNDALREQLKQNSRATIHPADAKKLTELYNRAESFRRHSRSVGKLAVGGAAGLGLLAAGAAVAGGATFMRRRRTKKGKIVVEQVRRKQ